MFSSSRLSSSRLSSTPIILNILNNPRLCSKSTTNNNSKHPSSPSSPSKLNLNSSSPLRPNKPSSSRLSTGNLRSCKWSNRSSKSGH